MDIAIIICTYNPEERIFRRCLDAVKSLRKDDLNVEVILVDNNSSNALESLDYVAGFLTVTGARCVMERKPGLTYARIAGFKASSAPVVIYFDDDNQPDKNYLLVATEVLRRKKDVGLLGPGIVQVDFIDGSNKWLESERPLFQELNMPAEIFGHVLTSYQEYYPFGTGLILKREIMQKYSDLVESQGEISDRKGNSLVGGGDIQIVWTGLKMGYHAGRTPQLRMQHIIPKSRTTASYIKKLSYSLGYSETKTRLGVFPEHEQKIKMEKKNFLQFYFLLAKSIVRYGFHAKFLFLRQVPNIVGRASGYYHAFNEKKPAWLSMAEALFSVKYYK
jgi:glycosyltransferase involved in cell wall biosynthesis